MLINFHNSIFRYEIIEDKFVILECLTNHLTSSNIQQCKLEDRIQEFGHTTILSYISPVSLKFIFIFVKYN